MHLYFHSVILKRFYWIFPIFSQLLFTQVAKTCFRGNKFWESDSLSTKRKNYILKSAHRSGCIWTIYTLLFPSSHFPEGKYIPSLLPLHNLRPCAYLSLSQKEKGEWCIEPSASIFNHTKYHLLPKPNLWRKYLRLNLGHRGCCFDI